MPSLSPPAAATLAPSRTLLIALGALVVVGLLAGIGGLTYYFASRGGKGNTNESINAGNNVNAGGSTNVNAGANVNAGQGGEKTPTDIVALPGGTFQMGRDDVPAITDELKRNRAAYLLWVYNHWPARSVTVKPFAIDRTEVTNGEYGEFVKAEGHPAPPEVWDGDTPRAGEEKFPVRNVTFEDAQKFAAWRSRRDGVTYRLPTEEEWEYAARGGDSSRVFPWGGAWAEGRANLQGKAPRAVGSYPEGRTPQGVEDMIGNVWEWTGSTAAMYKGNDRTTLPAADRGKIVVRGGAYESKPDGDEPINALARRWVSKDLRNPVLGFRLVRVGP